MSLWDDNEPTPVDPIADPNKLTTLADLNAALNNIVAAIKTATVRPKPRYVLDGQEFDWNTYMKMLTDAAHQIIQLRQMFGTPKATWLGKKKYRQNYGYGSYI